MRADGSFFGDSFVYTAPFHDQVSASADVPLLPPKVVCDAIKRLPVKKVIKQYETDFKPAR